MLLFFPISPAPHGTRRMDDEARGKIETRRHHALAVRNGPARLTEFAQLRARRTMDRATHTSGGQERAVGGAHHGIDGERRDVGSYEMQVRHDRVCKKGKQRGPVSA